MPQLTQGLIVAVLIGLLLAIIVGYYLRQSQVNELSEALQQSQQRQEDLAQEHEQRLREAILQLQKDYETQLAERMERYQAQYDEQRSQMEAEYQARQTMMGGASGEVDSSIEQRIRKQYETRLKEAATKIQQAYEQHLQEKLVEARSQAQQDYDQRLAAAIAHYQDEAQAHLTQDASLSLGALVPEPSPAGAANATDLAEVEARLQAQYDQRLAERIVEYQDDMAQRLAQMEQDHGTRLQLAQASSPGAGFIAAEPSTEELELNLRRELEASLREEYEQKLAEKIEHYQDELTQRTQELEQSYEAQLRLQSSPSEPPAPMADAGEFDLDSAIAAANAATLATNLEAGLDLNNAFSSPGSAAPPPADADLGFDAALLDSGSESFPGSEFVLDSDSDTENLETASLDLEEPLSPESAAPPAADADFGFDAALLDSDLENGPGNEFDLDPGEAFAAEPAAPPAASADVGFDDFLAGDLEPAQGDEFALNPDFDAANFDAENLDLDALLNAPPPDNASDDLLNGLDDISDLS